MVTHTVYIHTHGTTTVTLAVRMCTEGYCSCLVCMCVCIIYDLIYYTYIYISLYHKRTKKHFLNEQRNRDDAAKKRANTSGVGESNNYYEDIYNIPPYNNTH